ncbi:hypothetical protein NDU88_007416 [Pleurodeles waltl]|uniref:Uncharacterized protein n=1 Tax=Pleurodeles waltl TaxID=8319 RepID=A0AAV7N200_PLEWA|nr:hypothetical protein NDU88_007416 [Pleurodeles waltl]
MCCVAGTGHCGATRGARSGPQAGRRRSRGSVQGARHPPRPFSLAVSYLASAAGPETPNRVMVLAAFSAHDLSNAVGGPGPPSLYPLTCHTFKSRLPTHD